MPRFTKEDIDNLSNLEKRLDSFKSKINYVNQMWEKLKTLYKIKENGVDDLKIDFTGKWGRSSCDRKPEIGVRYGESSGIPQKVLDEMIKFYEINIDQTMDILSSLVIIRTDKM